jgi:hypothetical protein
MSSAEPEPHCERLQDCAAYVLWALADQEAESHGAHLAKCSVCQVEVAELQRVADVLPLGVPRAQVSEGLRTRIVGAAHNEAELRAAARLQALGAASSRADRSSLAGRSSWVDRFSRGGGTSSADGSSRVGRPAPRRRLVPALAGALALVVGLVIGALAFGSGSSVKTEVIHAAVVAPGYHATAELRKVGSQLELVVVGMPAPPPGRIYEVWLEHGAAAPLPTDALFSVTRSGDGSVGVPGNLRGVSKVLVTEEPLGGSLKPTRNPVILGSI